MGSCMPLPTLQDHSPVIKPSYPIILTKQLLSSKGLSFLPSRPRKLTLSVLSGSSSPAVAACANTTTNTEPKWPELIGTDNWENLLDPLDLNLRKLILRCGDFCQVTYDAFNDDQNSKYCGSSRYGKKNLFQKVMLESHEDYQVSSYLYATARVDLPEAFLLRSLSRETWDLESNWIGYIAVSTDESTKTLGRREIYVVWRGTIRDYEWIDVLEGKPVSAKPLLSSSKPSTEGNSSNGNVDNGNDEEKVEQGWLTIYTSNDPKSPFSKLSAQMQLLNKIKELRELYKDDKLSIIFTGHSLGASLAVLSALNVVEKVVTDLPVTAFIFGCPQVGNKAFNDRIKKHRSLKILHIKNTIDLIPLYPGKLLGYEASGIELVIDSRKSPNLNGSKNPSDWHNLQGMLHIVAGWNGDEGKFELKVKRSLALINKSCGFLKDEYLVPESWWVEKNKGMIRDKDGEWMLAPEAEDIPVPEY